MAPSHAHLDAQVGEEVAREVVSIGDEEDAPIHVDGSANIEVDHAIEAAVGLGNAVALKEHGSLALALPRVSAYTVNAPRYGQRTGT